MMSDLDDFVNCYFGNTTHPGSASHPSQEGSKSPPSGAEGTQRPTSATRHDRVETERFKAFTYDDLLKRDKVNLDIFWLKDEALEESANLPAPDVIAQEIMDDLQAALEQCSQITDDLKSS